MLQTKNEGQVNEGLCVGVLIVLIHVIVSFYSLYLSYCELVMYSRVYIASLKIKSNVFSSVHHRRWAQKQAMHDT